MKKCLLHNRCDALERLKTVTWPTFNKSKCFLEGHMPGSTSQMYSLCHSIDFSGFTPEKDLASLPCKAGGRECFYLIFGKACDLAVVCVLCLFPSDIHLIILNKFKLEQISWSADN